MRLSLKRSTAALISAGALTAVAVTGVAVSSPATPAVGADRVKAGKAEALAAADRVRVDDTSTYFRAGGEAKRGSDERAARVPLPNGGNFNGIRWTEVDTGVSAGDIDAVQQYNAACQWYRALAEGREVQTGERVIEQVPRWSAFRGQDIAARAAAVADDYAAGGEGAFAEIVRECTLSAVRERAYAKSVGLTPPL